MAIDDFQLGEGYLALAYGEHLVAGHLAEHEVDLVGASDKQVSIKVLLGFDEWDGLNDLTYEGTVLDPADYTFRAGTQTKTADARFPSSIYYNRISEYSATLPVGLGNEDRPDKMRAIARCLKLRQFDNVGTQTGYAYGTNHADVAVDLIRRNCQKLGLNLPDFVDWDSYLAARAYFGASINVDTLVHTPRAIRWSTSSGSLAAATYYIRIAAVGAGGVESSASDEIAVPVGASGRINLDWEATPDATSYKVFFATASGAQVSFFPTGTNSFSLTTTAVGTIAQTPLEMPTGAWLSSQPRFECHASFTQPTNLNDALNVIMWGCGGDWQKSGKRYRILTPEQRTSQHTLTVSNTNPGTFKYWSIDRKGRFNRVVMKFRNTLDPDLKSATAKTNRASAQSFVGVVAEEVGIGNMTPNQAVRTAHWRIRNLFDLNNRASVEGIGDEDHVLPADVLTLIDVNVPALNFPGKDFLVTEINEEDSDSGGVRTYTLQEYALTYSDTDKSPVNKTQPTDITPRTSPPPAVDSVTLTQSTEIRADGTMSLGVVGTAVFTPHSAPQTGMLYHKKPGGSYQYVAPVVPEPTTNVGGFRVYGVLPGTHYFKVVAVSDIGVPQTAAVVEYSIPVDYPTEATPTSLVCTNDADSNVLVEWVGTPNPAAPVMELYDVEVWNASDTTMLRSQPVKPSSDISESITWTEDRDDGSRVALKGTTGSILVGNANTSFYQDLSTSSASPVGGVVFEFSAFDPSVRKLPNGRIGLYTGVTVDGFNWQYTDITNNKIAPEGLTDYEVTVTTGMRFAIRLIDGRAEYYVNYAGPISAPLYVSGMPVEATNYRAYVFGGSGYSGLCGIATARWIRSGAEFKYLTQMQRNDFALSPTDPLPTSFRVRVNQRSRYGGAGRSAAASTLFTR